jgi:hypothetical protein
MSALQRPGLGVREPPKPAWSEEIGCQCGADCCTCNRFGAYEEAGREQQHSEQRLLDIARADASVELELPLRSAITWSQKPSRKHQ